MHKHSSVRRCTLTLFAAIAIGPFSGIPSAHAADDTVRIGFQKSSTLTLIAKARGTLAQALAPLGVKVQWAEFTSGTPLLEAINLGSIDVSADVADTVPIFAQAAGANLTYIALEGPSPEAQAIVVPKNSSIGQISDLRGKRIAATRGAGAHLLLARALQKVNLTLKDVQVAYLQPPDARAAFEGGSVDAWALWDPFLAELQKASDVRIIADGKGLTPYQRVYLAAGNYAARRPDVLKAFYYDLVQTGHWAKQNSKAAAELIAPIVGTDAATVERALNRRSLEVRSVQTSDFDEQQKIADTFLNLGVLPNAVVARNASVWTPK